MVTCRHLGRSCYDFCSYSNEGSKLYYKKAITMVIIIITFIATEFNPILSPFWSTSALCNHYLMVHLQCPLSIQIPHPSAAEELRHRSWELTQIQTVVKLQAGLLPVSQFYNLKRIQVVRRAVKGKCEVLHSVAYCKGSDSTTIIYILFVFHTEW